MKGVYIVVSIVFFTIVSSAHMNDDDSTQIVNRQKRQGGVVISILSSIAASAIYDAIKGNLPKMPCGRMSADASNMMYNNDAEQSQGLKDSVSEQNPDAGALIIVATSGNAVQGSIGGTIGGSSVLRFDNSFCALHGANVIASKGICTGSYCVCTGGVAEDQECPNSFVFDPLTGKCLTRDQAILCH